MDNLREDILVYIDGTEDSLRLIDAAVKLGGEVSALITGGDPRRLTGLPLRRIYVITDRAPGCYDAGIYAGAIAAAVRRIEPGMLLFAANDRGRDLAPRTAARMNVGLTADVTGMAAEKGRLLAFKPGKRKDEIITVVSSGIPQMVTVKTYAFDMPEPDGKPAAEIVETGISVGRGDSTTAVKKVRESTKKKTSLEEADVIVGGGRGLGGPRGFRLLREFAGRIGGEVACSAACVDQGWMDRSRLIGQTGLTVRPKIYIACGISGSIQHMAGVEGAEVIVAVNRDRNAQIFDYADYKIEGDLYEVVPELIRAWPR